MKNIVILISGRGSNMQALLNAKINCNVKAVISNRADARGLVYAQQHGIATVVVAHADYPDRAHFDAALADVIDKYAPDFVILAGFMRILTETFVLHYQGRLINIHPSLLPAYPGLHTHARALQDGVKIHGCTVHFVTADLDHGPVIIQAAVPVLNDDTEQTLSARILHEEHLIFPQAVSWLCTERIRLDRDGKVVFNTCIQNNNALISPALDLP
jgi:phosphoribosylglycinamide formyltransferase-1